MHLPTSSKPSVLSLLLVITCLLCAPRIITAHADATSTSNPLIDDSPLHGRLLDPTGAPLRDARIRVLSVATPTHRSLSEYLDRESKIFFMADESDETRALDLSSLHGLDVEARTDAEGRFTIAGAGRDHLAYLRITAPSVIETYLTAMTHDGPDVPILLDGAKKPTQTIHANRFTLQLQPGRTISGIVRDRDTHQPIAGMLVGRGWAGNYPRQGLMSEPVVSDAQGRFAISGWDPHATGINITAISAPGMTYQPASVDVNSESSVVIEAPRGIPFHLKLLDEQGKPVQAEVTAYDVTPNPSAPRAYCYPCYKPLSQAKQQADGSYVGFVVPGPGAVFVQTPDRSDYLPAHVDPKAFFAPGKTDWTAQEKITSFGSADTVAVTGGLVYQRDYAAIVLVNPPAHSNTLELSATIKLKKP